MSDVTIKGNKKIVFTPQGISYVLDMLANCPWKVANPLINDIMSQLRAQEGDNGGPNVGGLSETSAGGGHSGPRDSGLPIVEAVKPDNRVEGIGGYSCNDATPARAGSKGER
jgi:hypothetical protein